MAKDDTQAPKSVKPARTPEIAPGLRLRTLTPYGHMHLTLVTNAEGKEVEIFAQVGKSAEFISAELEGLCRLSSLYLRVGGSLSDIIKQLVGIGSVLAWSDKHENTVSLPDSLGRSLVAYVEVKKRYSDLMISTPPQTPPPPIPEGELNVMLFDPAKPDTVWSAFVIPKEEPCS